MFNPDFLNTIISEIDGNKTRTDSKDIVWTASKSTLGVIRLEIVNINSKSFFIFSAHYILDVPEDKPKRFIADREITGLGCVENFEICSATGDTEQCYSKEQIQQRQNNSNPELGTREQYELELSVMLLQASSFFSVAFAVQESFRYGYDLAALCGDSYDSDGEFCIAKPPSWETLVELWFKETSEKARFGVKE